MSSRSGSRGAHAPIVMGYLRVATRGKYPEGLQHRMQRLSKQIHNSGHGRFKPMQPMVSGHFKKSENFLESSGDGSVQEN